ncbi:glutaredoxin [Salinibius halmophilus]|uniref:glutaredoxin n=1 Tax=Salinibius halmophilus TaxID=1853216 RepID=UPI000E660846|nr:glutaredoxin [Salinibius halmophilus]
MTRKIFDVNNIAESAKAEVGGRPHQWIIDEVEQALQSNDYLVVGMKQNPFPKQAKKLLEAKGIEYKYLEYGSYFGQWQERLALKMYFGWPTFPMVFVKGQLIGGAKELKELLG